MIVIDTREPSSTKVQALRLLPQEALYEAALPCGDILLSKSVEWQESNFSTLCHSGILVERKEPSDFLSSLGDGRLFNQAGKMTECCPRALILITGSLWDRDGKMMAEHHSTGWDSWSVRMAMLRLQAGVRVLQIGSDELSTMVRYLRMMLDEGFKEVLPPKPVLADPFMILNSSQHKKIVFLMGLPNVGQKRATELLELHQWDLGVTLKFLLNGGDKHFSNVSKSAIEFLNLHKGEL